MLRKLPDNPKTFDCISPFLVQVLYQLATVLVRLGALASEEAEATQMKETVELLKTLLSKISPKWRLAGKPYHRDGPWPPVLAPNIANIGHRGISHGFGS
jgi:hypothetical protein